MGVPVKAELVKTSMVLRAEQVQRLQKIADARRISRSVILREALDEKLERLEAGAAVVREQRLYGSKAEAVA